MCLKIPGGEAIARLPPSWLRTFWDETYARLQIINSLNASTYFNKSRLHVRGACPLQWPAMTRNGSRKWRAAETQPNRVNQRLPSRAKSRGRDSKAIPLLYRVKQNASLTRRKGRLAVADRQRSIPKKVERRARNVDLSASWKRKNKRIRFSLRLHSILVSSVFFAMSACSLRAARLRLLSLVR